jgi:hypothetical protein
MYGTVYYFYCTVLLAYYYGIIIMIAYTSRAVFRGELQGAVAPGG